MRDRRLLTFPGGLNALRRLGAKRKHPFGEALNALPPVDCDLTTFKETLTPPPQKPIEPNGHIHNKAQDLAKEFKGQPSLLHLHALCIAMLRHDDPPDAAATLFLRMWEEEAEFLIRNLSNRWKISAVATFRDCGTTESQRRVGLALALFFNMIKLYESERLYSGRRPTVPFAIKNRVPHDIALDMGAFSIVAGDLDRNLMLYLWEDCHVADPVIRPLAIHLLNVFNAERRTVFRRLKNMRHRVKASKKRQEGAVNEP